MTTTRVANPSINPATSLPFGTGSGDTINLNSVSPSGTYAVAGKPASNKPSKPNNPLSDFTDSAPARPGEPQLRYGPNGLEVVNPGAKRSRPRATPRTARPPAGITPEQGLRKVQQTVNPPNRGNGFDASQKKQQDAARAIAVNPAIKARTVQLEGDRQVSLRARNNGVVFIDIPDKFNLQGKSVSLNVPGVKTSSTAQQIQQAVQKLCSDPRTVPYVYDSGKRPVHNDGGRQAAIEKASRNPDIAEMNGTDKLNYALGVAYQNATPAVAAELKALFTPENLVKMAILGGVQFIPGAGLIADVVIGICVGHQAIDVGIKYFNAIYIAMNATTKDELESSGLAIAQATAQLGVGVGTTLIGAGIAKGTKAALQNRAANTPTKTSFGSEKTRTQGGASIKPASKTKPTGTPNLGATLKAAQTTTENLVTAGTLGGLAYLKAKYDRGEIAIGYADQLPGMKNAISTIFNDASANNSVAGAQRQIVVYTTKPGTKEADGYFLANINGSVASSKIFNISNITKDIQNRTFNPGGWMDWGKINMIAQNLATKDQTGGGVRATVGSALSVNAGIYFGIPEINTRLKASINLMSVNGTIRAMNIGPNGKKQDKASKVEVAKALVQGYFNFYSAVPSKDSSTGKRVGQSPQVGGMQYQINKQLGLPGGFALQVSTVQPSKKEWNLFMGAGMTDGTNKKLAGETYPRSSASSTSAFNLLFNGNKNTNLNLGDVVAAPFTTDSKATGELGRQFTDFSEAMRHAFLDPYPIGSPGYIREKQLRQNSEGGTLSPY